MTASSPLVQLLGVGQRLGGRQVLQAVDLQVSGGELLGVIGPNGGGKSTLLLLMAGLLRPSTGQVLIEGVAAHRLASKSAGKVGLVTARPGLYPLLNAWENLEYFAGLMGVSRAGLRQKCDRYIQLLQLGDHMQQPVEQLSSGTRQKLSLVRALLMEPALLLLDEPTANLDPIAAHQIHGQVRARVDDGLAAVLVTHDLVSAEATCDRVVLLKQRVLEELKPKGPRRVPESGALMQAFLRAEQT